MPVTSRLSSPRGKETTQRSPGSPTGLCRTAENAFDLVSSPKAGCEALLWEQSSVTLRLNKSHFLGAQPSLLSHATAMAHGVQASCPHPNPISALSFLEMMSSREQSSPPLMRFGNVRNIWRITGSASLFGCLLIAVRQVSGSSPRGGKPAPFPCLHVTVAVSERHGSG